jgi:hypothetical protein
METTTANQVMDAIATLISFDVPVETIRAELLNRGLTEYDAYLSYKATLLLIKVGFYAVQEQAPPKTERPSFRSKKP